MKLTRKYKRWLLLLALPFLVITCMTIEEVIHPDDARVDSDIDILVKIKIDAETDGNSKLAFGVLAPKSWNLARNATLTLTTAAGFAANAVTDEPMQLIPATETNPSDGQPWAASFQSRFGVLGNTGPVEWVVFESATTFKINDKQPDQKVINGTVKIRVHTGSQAVKLFMGYTFCGKAFGFDGEKYPDEDAVVAKLLEVTGGDALLWDYTADPALSFVPATFGFGDIFAIKYNENNALGNGLKGGKVYLAGQVSYVENGAVKEKSVDEISGKTLMEESGSTGQITSWQKYIYPKEFFGLPANAVIQGIRVHFTNENKSVVIRDNESEEDFIIEETCE